MHIHVSLVEENCVHAQSIASDSLLICLFRPCHCEHCRCKSWTKDKTFVWCMINGESLSMTKIFKKAPQPNANEFQRVSLPAFKKHMKDRAEDCEASNCTDHTEALFASYFKQPKNETNTKQIINVLFFISQMAPLMTVMHTYSMWFTNALFQTVYGINRNHRWPMAVRK